MSRKAREKLHISLLCLEVFFSLIGLVTGPSLWAGNSTVMVIVGVVFFVCSLILFWLIALVDFFLTYVTPHKNESVADYLRDVYHPASEVGKHDQSKEHKKRESILLSIFVLTEDMKICMGDTKEEFSYRVETAGVCVASLRWCGDTASACWSVLQKEIARLF